MARRMMAVDWETIEETADGPVASTEAYRPSFRVSSLAAAWREGSDRNTPIKTAFVQGEEQCHRWMMENAQSKPLLAHNVQFELLVSTCRFPELNLNWAVDSMRLAQNYDNGGGENDVEYVIDDDLRGSTDPNDAPKIKRRPLTGLGLAVCCKRILDMKESHKTEAHEWIRANVPKSKGKEGKFLHLLPLDILERYNIADAVNSLLLAEFCIDHFDDTGFDWRVDHELFLSTVKHLVQSKIRGVDVDRDLLRSGLATVQQEVADIERSFAHRFANEISTIENRRSAAWVASPKTERGRAKRQEKLSAKVPKVIEALAFNVGSNKQLFELFGGELGFEPKFFTAKGAPSFKSSVLSQWGEGGEMLKKRRKRGIVLKQMEALLALSEYDGKWHMSMRAAGTSTGRMAGGN